MNTQAKIIIVSFMLSLVYQQGVAQWVGPGTTGSGDIYIENSKVGIGVTSPQETLHINGNLRGNQAGAIRIKSLTGYLDIGSKNEYWAHFHTDRAKMFLQKRVALGEGILASHDTKNLSFNTGMTSSSNGIARMTILNGNGYIGLGTNSPRFPLDVKTSEDFEGNNLYVGNRRLYLAGITGTGSQMYGGLVLTNQGNGGRSLDFVVGNNDFDVNTTPENRAMSIMSSGNVGIGTNAPNYKLEIEKSNAANNTEYLLGAFNHSGNAGGIYIGYIGNGTDAQEAVLRSGGNINLNLGTSAYRNAMTVSNSNGNVGIGTAAPDEKFHVNGTTTIVADIGSPTNPHYQIGSHTLELQNNDEGDVVLAFHRAGYSSAHIKHNNSGELILSSSGTPTKEHFLINSEGQVAIGAATSDQKLTVGGSINVGGTENAQVRVRHVNGKSHTSTDLGNLYLNYTSEYPVYVGQASNEADLYVFGKVGIGTSNPTEAMEVNGIIRSKEILVEASPWPDYVFAPEYNLRSLTETKAFIEENHHLPGIPSAAEVEENGIAVGDMQAKLLQKIEELTLYVIDQGQQIEILREENAKIKSDLTRFESQDKGE